MWNSKDTYEEILDNLYEERRETRALLLEAYEELKELGKEDPSYAELLVKIEKHLRL
jgi:hypothetical protein